MQEIPFGKTIVGWKLDADTNDTYISQLSLILGVIGTSQLAGEISLPATKSFPQFLDFKSAYASGQTNYLTDIEYAVDSRGELKGLQFLFEEYESPMF